MAKLAVMNKTIWLIFGISMVLTFVSCLLPNHTTDRILIREEDDKNIQPPTTATSGYDDYFVQRNYCVVKFPAVNPAK
jgi:type IV secretory pathway component VirB8